MVSQSIVFSWRFQLPLFADLGYEAWAPNLRGYGQSSKPEAQGAYAIEELMEDVAQLIDASGAREVTLVAHDWGAVDCVVFCDSPSAAVKKINHL